MKRISAGGGVANELPSLLRSLAAQVRPMMKSEGLKVNSLEEYQFNQVFVGRNWNAGDVSGISSIKTIQHSD